MMSKNRPFFMMNSWKNFSGYILSVCIFFQVGAPQEMASLLEEISKESHPVMTPGEIGADRELDQFMVRSYDSLSLD